MTRNNRIENGIIGNYWNIVNLSSFCSMLDARGFVFPCFWKKHVFLLDMIEYSAKYCLEHLHLAFRQFIHFHIAQLVQFMATIELIFPEGKKSSFLSSLFCTPKILHFFFQENRKKCIILLISTNYWFILRQRAGK